MKNSPLLHWYKRRKGLLFGISACIIATLLVVLGQALEREMARAEEAMFRTVVAELNAMLVYKTAEKVAQNKKQEIKNFVNHNPMEWMETTPVNYSGIEDDYAQVNAGRWFFAQTEQAIVYKVINTDMVEIDGTDKPEYLRFRVVLDYLDNNKNQQFDELEERLIGLRLQPLQHFKWFAISGNGRHYDTK
ncbi:hypothetical protein [Alkalimarinus alittae]|uniref:Uncharacterized protein n=1 Tax=Alkalimarinus alittae TaxID=2961619 RepID=A0ABY6N0Z8_9ALTE|nr:hypothetical protein [Alkalimarinus alittae]UZE95781.1 hypothetical protein NKI27_17255 [Alkalimarinus alittae]